MQTCLTDHDGCLDGLASPTPTILILVLVICSLGERSCDTLGQAFQITWMSLACRLCRIVSINLFLLHIPDRAGMRHNYQPSGLRGDDGTRVEYIRGENLSWEPSLNQQLPALAQQQNLSPRHALSSAFSMILTNFKKYVLRHSVVSRDIKFAPSFNRRTFGPVNSSKPESTPFQATRFIFLCIAWYTTSALSSNTGKTILISFSYPVTLTIIQFVFVASYCLLLMAPFIRFTKLRLPSCGIIKTTLPMGAFQVGGHILSSMAISRIPVSTVHTIKASLFGHQFESS